MRCIGQVPAYNRGGGTHCYHRPQCTRMGQDPPGSQLTIKDLGTHLFSLPQDEDHP